MACQTLQYFIWKYVLYRNIYGLKIYLWTKNIYICSILNYLSNLTHSVCQKW